VYIESLQVRTSDPGLPFGLAVFEHKPETGEEIEKEDVARIEIAKRRTVTWPAGAPFLYKNADGQNRLYGVLAIGHRIKWTVVKQTKSGNELTP
jgi:hypothetical protein